MTRTLAVVAAICAAVRAGELTPPERDWAQACMKALDSESERVAKGAARALAAMGVDAIPVIVEESPRVKTDKAWTALGECATAMGAAEAAAALGAVQPRWPAAARDRLKSLVESLRAAAPASSPEVAQRVREILVPYARANSWSTDDPAVRRIVALGHDAVPELLKIVGEPSRGFNMESDVAAEALSQLVRAEDRPLLAKHIAQGDLKLAKALARIPGEESLDALLVPVGKGLMSHALLEALREQASSPRVEKALVDYLDRFGTGDYQTGAVAEFLGERGVWDAKPILSRLLKDCRGSDCGRRIAQGLVQLGGKEGIPVLLDVFSATGGRHDEWDRHEAGEFLNRVRGERTYVGSFGGPGESQGNFEEAAASFRAWWATAEATIRFDRETRRWSVP